jgi:hypothetical protein
MRALIYEVPEQIGAGLLDVAGRPLLVRQLQWLRHQGIEDITVEVCVGPHDSARGAFLLGTDPLVSRVTVQPSRAPLGVEALSLRAGVPADELFVALPADVLTGATLDLAQALPRTLRLDPPADTPLRHAEVALRTRGDVASALTPAGAWGARIHGLTDALALSCAALEGKAPGIMLHAAETAPGVWIARGADVSARAKVTPPVLVGAGAIVVSCASIGPRAVIGDRAVIDRDASVVDAIVAPSTILGEGTRVRSALATARSLVDFRDGTRASIADHLVLSARDARVTPFFSRLVAALIAMVLVVPWLLVALVYRARSRPVVEALHTRGGQVWHLGRAGIRLVDLVPSLYDVMRGVRDLVGVGHPPVLEIVAKRLPTDDCLRPGAFDISARLLGAEVSASALLRMWRWYAQRKCPSLDRALLTTPFVQRKSTSVAES